MKAQLVNSWGFLRTTAVGGLLFLLPFAVVVGLLAYVYHAAVVAYAYIKDWIPLSSVTGIALLFSLAVAAILAACFFAGLVARRAMGRHFSGTIEKQLMKVIPKYGIYKDLLAGKIGGDGNVPSLRPVLVKREGVLLPAFQADQLANGLVVIYLPGAPDAWNGSVVLVAAENVLPLAVRFADLLGVFERLGRDSNSQLGTALARSNR
jgi:uncharacterized membrane protein